MIYLLPQLLFTALLLIFKRKYSNYRIAAYSAIFLYLSMIIIGQIEGYLIEVKADACDTDGDGFWSDEERANCEETLRALTSDTGRNMIFFFGIPLIFVWFTIVYSFLWLLRKYIDRLLDRCLQLEKD